MSSAARDAARRVTCGERGDESRLPVELSPGTRLGFTSTMSSPASRPVAAFTG
jgi:hypothetical protein